LDDPQRDPSGILNVQWTLWVELDNTTTKALVDSGSGESLVTQELLKKNPSIERRLASPRWFQGAWGEYQSNIIAVIPFTAGGTQWVVHAYICEELPYHLILGSRFITGYGWQLDGRRGCVKVGNQYLTTAQHPVKLPENSTMVVNATIDPFDPVVLRPHGEDFEEEDPEARSDGTLWNIRQWWTAN